MTIKALCTQELRDERIFKHVLSNVIKKNCPHGNEEDINFQIQKLN